MTNFYNYNWTGIIGLLIFLLLPVTQVAGAQDKAVLSSITGSEVTSTETIEQSSSLESVLAKIEKRYNVNFFFKSKLLAGQTISVKRELQLGDDMFKVLEQLLNGTGFTYKVLTHRTIGIVPETQDIKQEINLEMVTGTVTDATSGETLPGVNVLVKGTTTGTSTNSEGVYDLDVPSLQDTLVFSFIGYQTRDVPINGRTTINVELQSQAVIGEELVVVGYGTTRKSDLTGSVSQVSSEDLNHGINTNVEEALIGKVSGMQVSQTTGAPGGGISIRIRGASSITAGNEPLYVIDGMPIDNSPTVRTGGEGNLAAGLDPNPNPKNPLNSLNPHDIESIEILKDASATAIYGSRGANGVILITTKGGSQDQTIVNYNFLTSFQKTAERYDILNAKDYMSALNAISVDRGDDPIFTSSDLQSVGEGTDWQDQIYRVANSQTHNISISGGNENLSYFLAGNFADKEGTIKNNRNTRYSLRANLDSEINDNFDLKLNLSTSQVEDKAAVTGNTHNERSGVIYSAVYFDPTLPVRNEDGGFTTSDNLLLQNPVAVYDGIKNQAVSDRLLVNTILTYNISDELSSKINFGVDRQFVRRDVYNSTKTFIGQVNNGIAYVESLERSNIVAEYTVNYQKTINQDHVIKALAGVTYQDSQNRGQVSEISDFPTDVVETNNLGLGNSDQASVNSNHEGYSLLSYLGRVNYNIFDKFLFTGTFRADGSSRFGENNRFGYFPSFALGWKLASESFIPDIFNQLKLRTSWGLTGNQEITNFASISTFTPSGAYLFDHAQHLATSPTRLENPDLKWESTEQFNIGLDVSILDDRISGTIDYFVKKTSDMLIFMPLPLSSGFDGQLRNVGKMTNTGFETQINSRNISLNNFTWSTSLNFSTVKNEVNHIGGLNRILLGEVPDAGENGTIIKPGVPLNSYYGYRIIGIYQTEQEVANSAQPNSEPGFPIFDDVNGDGIINSDDKTILGDPFPDFTFGIRNTFNYKNIGLDIFINGSYGNELMNATAMGQMYPSNFRRNRSSRQIQDRWTPNNTDAAWPSATSPNAYGPGKVHSMFVEDASYIRLKSVKLSYSIPTRNIGFLRSADLNIIGENLITLTNYSGINPDANVYGRNNFKIAFMSYPLPKTLTFGLNVSF